MKNSTPIIEEGDVFKLVIPYNLINGGINEGLNQGEGINKGLNTKDHLLKIITKNEGLNVNKLAELLGTSNRTVERYIRILKSEGKIKYRGARKSGG